jgi:hypothetical protein
MKAFTRTSAVLLINAALLTGCSMNRADSLRMLDSRAEYEDMKAVQELRMREAGIEGMRNNPVPVRTRPKVAAIWIHAHEMASRDYFWGGWMSVVVEADQWVLTKPHTQGTTCKLYGRNRSVATITVEETPLFHVADVRALNQGVLWPRMWRLSRVRVS